MSTSVAEPPVREEPLSFTFRLAARALYLTERSSRMKIDQTSESLEIGEEEMPLIFDVGEQNLKALECSITLLNLELQRQYTPELLYDDSSTGYAETAVSRPSLLMHTSN